MNISAVIGSNYGDEGKGLVTDYLASRQAFSLYPTMVVRYNGGAQAGHTVVTNDGRRHVFKHFGSGTFSGASTFLSKYFILNPILFVKEWKELVKEYAPKVFVDYRCRVTTPYDMMLNQAIEESRGDARHGSCGIGINETIIRSDIEEYSLFFDELIDKKNLEKKLLKIRNEYVPDVMKKYNLPITLLPYLKNDTVLARFIYDAMDMSENVRRSCWDSYNFEKTNIIFEGAQGLQLDMESKNFPHVTRSRTGLYNITRLLEDIGCSEIPEVYYVTRTYLTRHGAGPLPNEIKDLPYASVKDETNIKNDFQGALRYAYLDIGNISEAIKLDGQSVARTIKPKLFITCVDQLDDGVVKYYDNGAVVEKVYLDFGRELGDKIGADRIKYSHRPTGIETD